MKPCPSQKQVIVVEDNQDLLKFEVQFLERYGYKVWQAANHQEALAVLTSMPKSPDVAIVDFLLADADGLEVARQMKLLCPALSVIITSGYNRENITSFPAELSKALFLHKPFPPNDLKKTVQAALSASVLS